MKIKSAAVLTIKDAAKMTPSGRKSVRKWLIKQADFFRDYHKKLSPRFTARYLYTSRGR
mgnify:CR=1 FL=1